MPDVTFTVDGKKITAPAGTLLIEACKGAGIEIPAFCYYPGLSLQAACRMCVVRQEKVPKLQTGCTTQVAEGQVFFTETPEIVQARKATLQLLLGNHPLDCPVCDAGGECELQDMTFKYGAADSFYAEPKNHRDEQQWSPVVYFDRPRCILCYRCVRMCGEGMDVFALGVENRGASSIIAPNVPAHLSPDQLAHVDCEQCGMCIDACPVGALTSGTYRYKTRPWEMNHVATVCTHCGDGCKTTLGVRSTSDGSEIVRGDNRDKSGINGDFLCNKGRYAFDFANSAERITTPLLRQLNGTFKPASWEEALTHVGQRFAELRDTRGGSSIGVIGGNRLTNEEAYLLQKFARSVLGTNNIDHHRTADYVAFAQALSGTAGRAASLHDTQTAKAILIVGGDPTTQAPATAWNLRTNVRLNGAKLYIANTAPSSSAARPAPSSKSPSTATARSPLTSPATTARRAAPPANPRRAHSLPRCRPRRRLPPHPHRQRAPRRRTEAPHRLRPHPTQRKVRPALRLRQLPRRSRHGPAPRHAPGYTPIGPIDTQDPPASSPLSTPPPPRPASTCWRSSTPPPWATSPRSTSSPPTPSPATASTRHAQGHLRRCTGHVPHRDRRACRRHPARRQPLRKIRFGHK
jgi:NADH dehydrogenase/NADH:ubiquinone oxidoreductase subunit G